MGALGYGLGGLGQGLAAGKQFRYERQMKQSDLALRQKQEADVNAATQHAANQEMYNNLSKIVHDPNFVHTYTPQDQAGIVGKWQGFLRAHPEFDYGNEIGNLDARVQSADQTADQVGRAILTDPNGALAQTHIPSGNAQPGLYNLPPDQPEQGAPSGPLMNPSVASQPLPQGPPGVAAPTPYLNIPNGLPPLNGQTQAGPVQPTVQNAAPPTPSPASPTGQTQAGPVQTTVQNAAPPTPSPASPTGQTPGTPDATQGGAGLLALSDQDPLSGLKETHNHWWMLAHSPDGAISDDYRNQAYASLAKADGDLADATRSRKEAGLASVNTDLAPKLAASTIGAQGAAADYARAQTKEEPANAAAQRAAEYASAGESKARAEAIPVQQHQAQESIDISRAAQNMDSIYKMGDLNLRNSALQKELAQLGLSVQQWQLARRQTIEQMNNEETRLHIERGDPGYNGAIIAKAVADNAFYSDPLTHQPREGKTFPAWLNMLAKKDPAAKTFDFAGYLADKRSSPSQKAAFFKQQGWPIPATLAQSAAADVSGGGGNPRPVTAGGR